MATAPSYPSGVETLSVHGTAIGDYEIEFTSDTVINSIYVGIDGVFSGTGTVATLSILTGATAADISQIFKVTFGVTTQYHVDAKAASQGDYTIPIVYPTVASTTLAPMEVENMPAAMVTGTKLRLSIATQAATSADLIVAGIKY